MANFIANDIKSIFRNNNYMGQIIVVNVIIFIFLNVVKASYGFGLEGKAFYSEFLPWFGIPTNSLNIVFHFWTLFTYMFSHVGFGHILWNMLLLYWFGRILQDLTGQEKLLYAYLGGGLIGGFFFALSTLIPGLYNENTFALIGASGGVLSVVVAAATIAPNYQISLILIGPVRIKYLALFIFVTSTLLDLNFNTGGKLAHLGGALFGFFYITKMQQGVNLAAPMQIVAAFFSSFFRRKPPENMRVVYNKNSQTHNIDADLEQKVDAILDKINSSGYDSLSKSERELLFRASKRNE